MRRPTPRRPSTPPTPTAGSCVGSGRTLQGYNAQAAATTEQVVVAAELTQQANDLQQLVPMLTAIRTTLAGAGIDARPQRLAADSGYWSIANVSAIPDAPELLIPPARHGRHGKPRKDGKPSESRSDSLRAAMLARLASAQGEAGYAQRSRTIEPVFGQVKTVQGGRRFMRRGLRACRAEWKLLCGTTTCSSCGACPRSPPADRHGTAGAPLTVYRLRPVTRFDATTSSSAHPSSRYTTPLRSGLLGVNPRTG
jgi:hypothetical protein